MIIELGFHLNVISYTNIYYNILIVFLKIKWKLDKLGIPDEDEAYSAILEILKGLEVFPKKYKILGKIGSKTRSK